jgi:hypothetical protein
LRLFAEEIMAEIVMRLLAGDDEEKSRDLFGYRRGNAEEHHRLL